MSYTVILGVLLAANCVAYAWVNNAIISQPYFNWPVGMMNPKFATLCLMLPIGGFISIIIAAFVLTGSGLWFLAASAAAYFLLAKPTHPDNPLS